MQHLRGGYAHEIADWAEPSSDIHQTIVNALKQKALEVSLFYTEVGDP